MTARTTAHVATALEYASQDFDEADPVRHALMNVVHYLTENAGKNIQYLTFGTLRQAAQLSDEDGEILHKTIAYLTGKRANLLTIAYEFIDDDFEHELLGEELAEFLANGEFCDPRTGREVAESGNFIYVFFRPNYAAFH